MAASTAQTTGLDDDLPSSSSVTGLDDDEELNVEQGTNDQVAHPYDAITITSALALLVGRDRLADVRFAVGKGEEKRIIPAHRVVLAASSALFEAMLYPPRFPDDDTKHGEVVTIDKEQIIDIPDCKPAAFKAMLQCLYSDTCSIRAEDLPDIIYIANKYQLEPLRRQITKFMSSGVNIENACSLYTTAHELLNEPQLAITFIEENAAEIFASHGFDSLSPTRLASILESDNLCIDEIDLFNAVLRWSLSACKRAHLTDTIEHRRQVLAPVIPHIRFPLISMEEIATIVAPSQILTPVELLEIFTYLGQPESSKPTCPYPTKPRAGARAKWHLDPNYKTSNSTLSNDNHTFTHPGGSHSYVLGDMQFSKGIHSWRIIRESGQSQWLLVAMSTKKSYSDASYSDSGVWGLSSASQQYTAGQTGSLATDFTTGPLDCTFNSDEGTFSILNLNTNVTVTMTNLPKNQPLVPHFGPHSHQTISVYPIRVKDVGVPNLKLGKK